MRKLSNNEEKVIKSATFSFDRNIDSNKMFIKKESQKLKNSKSLVNTYFNSPNEKLSKLSIRDNKFSSFKGVEGKIELNRFEELLMRATTFGSKHNLINSNITPKLASNISSNRNKISNEINSRKDDNPLVKNFTNNSIIEKDESISNMSSCNSSDEVETERITPNFNIDSINNYLKKRKEQEKIKQIEKKSAKMMPKLNTSRNSKTSLLQHKFNIDSNLKEDFLSDRKINSNQVKMKSKLSTSNFYISHKEKVTKFETKHNSVVLTPRLMGSNSKTNNFFSKNARKTFSESEIPRPYKSPGVVLIADDLTMNQSNLKKRIETIKNEIGGLFEIKVVSDGICALAMIIEDNIFGRTEDKVKLLLCDNLMEFVNGYTVVEMLHEFKNQGKLNDLPYLVCTTAAAEEDQIDLLNGGFDEVTNKFLTKTELVELLRKGNLLD